jgi:hypothetical protein
MADTVHLWKYSQAEVGVMNFSGRFRLPQLVNAQPINLISRPMPVNRQASNECNKRCVLFLNLQIQIQIQIHLFLIQIQIQIQILYF